MKSIIDQMACTSEVAQYSVLSATKRNVDKSSVAKSTMYEIVCFIQNIFGTWSATYKFSRNAVSTNQISTNIVSTNVVSNSVFSNNVVSTKMVFTFYYCAIPLLEAVHKRHRNFSAVFDTPLPHVGILTLIYT